MMVFYFLEVDLGNGEVGIAEERGDGMEIVAGVLSRFRACEKNLRGFAAKIQLNPTAHQ